MRGMLIGFMFLAFSLSMSIVNEINDYYMYGSVDVSRNRTYENTSRLWINYYNDPGVDGLFVDVGGVKRNLSNFDEYNESLRDFAAYQPQEATGGLLEDTAGLIKFVVSGVRIIINTILMPITGFPNLLMDFYVPPAIAYGLGTLMFITVIISLVGWVTNRGF